MSGAEIPLTGAVPGAVPGAVSFTQAVFGDVAGQTDELARSGSYTEILSLTADLPETLPAGFTPPPHISVQVADGAIGFFKTAIDPGASRGGMVRTHLLVAPADSVVAIDDIGPVLSALDPFVPADEVRGGPFVLSGNNVEVPASPGSLPLVIELLRCVARPSDPVVWVGVDEFPDVLRSLWARAPGALRRALSVRIALRPQNQYATDRVVQRAQLLVVPSELGSFWSGIPAVTRETPDPEGLLAVHLDGGESPLAPLLDALEIDVADVSSFDDVERAAEYLARLDSGTDPLSSPEGLLLAEIIDALAPGLRPDAPVRSAVVEALVRSAALEEGRSLHRLRTFDAEAFEGGLRVLGAHARAWSEWALGEGREDPYAVKMTRLAFESHNEAWNEAVQKALRDRLRSSPARARTVVAWWSAHPDLMGVMSSLVPRTKGLEDAFVEALEDPSLSDPSMASPLRLWATEQSWSVLHARALTLSEMAPEVALAEQIGFEGKRRDVAIRYVAAWAPDAVVVRVAGDTGDDVLVGVAAESVARDPALLSDVDPWTPTGQKIIAGVVPGGTRVPGDVVRSVVNGIVSGRPFPPELLLALVGGPGGDLLDLPGRSEAWAELPGAAREAALRATARSWGEFFHAWASGADVPEPDRPELPLARAIESEASPSELLPVTARVRPTLSLFSAVRFSEGQFTKQIQRMARTVKTLSAGDARALGAFVSERRWKSSARALRELGGWHPSYKEAYRETSHLFGPFEGLRAVFAGGGAPPERLSAEEWWPAFEDLASQLYPKGLLDRSILERAGGDVSEVSIHGASAREQWHDLATRLKLGALDIGVRDVLLAMRDHHRNNENLSLMLDLYDTHLAS